MPILCEKMMKSDESDEKTILVLYHIKGLPEHPQLLIFWFQLVAQLDAVFWFHRIFPIHTERNIGKMLSHWSNVFNERNMSNCLRNTIFRKYLFSWVIKLYSVGINFHKSKKFQPFSGVHFREFNLFQYLFFQKCVCNTKFSLTYT